jgi:chromosome segregation ATPase
MPSQILRRLKPEEEEIHRKREELAALRAALAEGELEVVDLRSQLAAFEGLYLREIGALYAELDEWTARVSELRAKLDPSPAARSRAGEARERARARRTKTLTALHRVLKTSRHRPS